MEESHFQDHHFSTSPFANGFERVCFVSHQNRSLTPKKPCVQEFSLSEGFSGEKHRIATKGIFIHSLFCQKMLRDGDNGESK